MRGLKSTIALIVVLVGLGAYIYFVTSKTPEGDSAAAAEAGEGLRRAAGGQDRRDHGHDGGR